jgi:predicted RNA-binding Zn ribbon-like protein
MFMAVTSSWEHSRDPAPGELRLVQDFVNTLDSDDGFRQIETLRQPADLERWLRERELVERGARIGPAELRRALDLRGALRALLLAHAGAAPRPEALDVVNRAAAAAHAALRFHADGSTELVPAARGLDGAFARILGVVAGAMADGTWERLKACPNDDCEWAFYDRSRNRSSRWCNMAECGNRAKARAFRERRGGPKKRQQ